MVSRDGAGVRNGSLVDINPLRADVGHRREADFDRKSVHPGCVRMIRSRGRWRAGMPARESRRDRGPAVAGEAGSERPGGDRRGDESGAPG